MEKPRVAIVGSGVVGVAVTHHLVSNGYDVVVLEKGPEYPYPHRKQFREEVRYLYVNPKYTLPADLKNHTIAGDYNRDIEKERFMNVGGSATRWEAITLRMTPDDFKVRSMFNYGMDWPISYDELERFYGKAERFLGVSGTDSDNPSAPPRSEPYPLPPFELSYDDLLLAERLKSHGIVLHTTPQARTRKRYDGRAACVNFSTCPVCPIGARYSPNFHIDRLLGTGRFRLITNASVRRIVPGKSGQAPTLVYRQGFDAQDSELAADVVVLAAGAVENTRLLLLSRDGNHPDGLGNNNGLVGRNYTFHHIWRGIYSYKDKLHPGRFQGWTGQIQQFVSPPERGRHGGIKIEFSSRPTMNEARIDRRDTSSDIIKKRTPSIHQRSIGFHAESVGSDHKYITLSSESDAFGDPWAHINYRNDEFDHNTYLYSEEIFQKCGYATGAADMKLEGFSGWDSGSHHMGGCIMGSDEKDSVVDSYGMVRGVKGVFVLGASMFPGSSGPFNPTLTLTALALRAAEYIQARML